MVMPCRSLWADTRTGGRAHVCPHGLTRRTPCNTRYKIPTIIRSSCSASTRHAVEIPELRELPATYKRLVAKRTGPSFRQVAVVHELPLLPPEAGEVLIRVTHAGINGGCETFRARGEYAFAANRNQQDFSLGAEGAGVVVALGPDVAAIARGGGGGEGGGGLKVGQLVAFNGGAAFSEYVTVRPSLVTAVPEGLTGAEGVALVLSGVTACVALEATARVRPAEVVVVTAAAGGTGHLAVQLAAAAGATVVAVVGSPRKAEAMAALSIATGGPTAGPGPGRGHGQLAVVDYTRQDVVATLRWLFPEGVDVVYDGVGGTLRNQLLTCLRPSGRLLQVGYISEYPHTQRYRWTEEIRNGGGGDGGGANPNCLTVAGAPQASGRDDRTAEAAVAVLGGPPPAGAPQAAAAFSAAAAAGVEAAAATVTCTATEPLPSSAELFWGSLDVTLGGGRRIIGQIWPKDLKTILKCRRRVFDLARRGQLRVLTDQGHGRRGVEGVADAIDYMLRGEHIGKVIIEM